MFDQAFYHSIISSFGEPRRIFITVFLSTAVPTARIKGRSTIQERLATNWYRIVSCKGKLVSISYRCRMKLKWEHFGLLQFIYWSNHLFRNLRQFSKNLYFEEDIFLKNIPIIIINDSNVQRNILQVVERRTFIRCNEGRSRLCPH